MNQGSRPSGGYWTRVGTRFLPFADAASADLPLGRLLRLSLFQVTVGMAIVLMNGTLNRVMIVELGLPAWLVALMLALPLVTAPFRALLGHKSDTHRSVLGWRRVPYIWFGTLMMFGGFALMPFSLLLLTQADTAMVGQIAAAASFLLTGAGMHTTQTAGLALATDIAPEANRPRVVALLYVMLLGGMMISAFAVAELLRPFSPTRLVQVVQGAGVLAVVLNIIALWKQEARNPAVTARDRPRPRFGDVWAEFVGSPRTVRLLIAVGIGAAAFSMQDVLLEPYGGEILGLSVSATTGLTGIWAFGMLLSFALAARWLGAGFEPHRLAGLGGVAGIVAFLLVLFAAPLGSAALLYAGAAGIGFGGGLFAVGTLNAAMALAPADRAGIALGGWGAVQATCAGLAIAIGGAARDLIANAALADGLGPVLAHRATGYGSVYVIEIALLLVMLIVLGPLVRERDGNAAPERFGLSEFPA